MRKSARLFIAVGLDKLHLLGGCLVFLGIAALVLLWGGGDLLGWTKSPPQGPRAPYVLFALALLGVTVVLVYIELSEVLAPAHNPEPDADLPMGSVLRVRLRRQWPDLVRLVLTGMVAVALLSAAVVKVVWIGLGGPVGTRLWEAPMPPSHNPPKEDVEADEESGPEAAVPARHPPDGGDWFIFVVLGLLGLVVLRTFIISFAELLPGVFGMRVPRVELSHFPVERGRNYHLLVSQLGPVHSEKWGIKLVCQQKKRYLVDDGWAPKHQTEEQCVYEHQLAYTEGLQVPFGQAHEARLRLFIREDAPASSTKLDCTITWSIVIYLWGWYLPRSVITFPLTVV